MAYTSFKQRKALGRRYGTDPALLLEMERLQQQYALAPGREARGMQAAQFQQSMAFNQEQAVLNRKEREEAADQAATSGMVGTASNVATTGLMLKYLSPKATPVPAEVSWTAGNAKEIASAPGYGTQAPSPATIDTASAGIGIGAGADAGAVVGSSTAEGGAYGLGQVGTGSAVGSAGGSTTGSVLGGIGSGVATAAPYYAAAKFGGQAASYISEQVAPGESTPLSKLGESLEKPLGQEKFWAKEAFGDDEVLMNVMGWINPVGAAEEWVSDAVGTVICTELHRQGIMSDEVFETDKSFGKKQDIETIAGYHTWAIPLASLMRKYKIVTWVITPIAMAWAEDMAGGKNMFGKILNKIGIPICRFIGRKALEVAHG